jgi:transcriptional regulator with XRE-family HTH domain
MAIHESWQHVGAKIRSLRKSNGLTLRQLALGSDLSVNTISLVERSEVAPTIETLCKISNALGVSPGSLFLEICQTGIDTDQVFRDECERGPGEVVASSELKRPVERRFSIMCLSGQVEVEVNGNHMKLFQGESLELNSEEFHRWGNQNQATGIVLLVFPNQ